VKLTVDVKLKRDNSVQSHHDYDCAAQTDTCSAATVIFCVFGIEQRFDSHFIDAHFSILLSVQYHNY